MQKYICCKGKLLSIEKPLIMGILNVTRDSFYDGGRYFNKESYLKQAEKLLQEGADFIDVGCASTRPQAVEIPETEELRTAVQVVDDLLRHFPQALISVDTWRASVAGKCIEAGAAVINDISGGDFDPAMFETVARLQVPYILTHTSGRPEVMQQHTGYADVVREVYLYLDERIRRLHLLNVKDVIADVGFGFGKTIGQNYELLRNFHIFQTLDCPLLCALSRKSMLYKITGGTPADALEATVAAHVLALQQGARFLRVHDVRAAKDAIAIYNATAGTRQ